MSVENDGSNQHASTPETQSNSSQVSLPNSVVEPKLEAEHPEWYAYSLQQNPKPWFIRIGLWIKKKADHTGLHDWLMVFFTFALTIVGVEQGILAYQNSRSSAVQMRKFLDATNRIEDAADSFSKSSADISRGVNQAVNQFDRQAGATETAAGAAKSAAITAKDTLHIAQRAYIFTGVPSMNYAEGKMHIPLINSGHMPSGPIQIKAFQVTVDVQDPSHLRSGKVIDKHWIPLTRHAIEIGQLMSFSVPVRKAIADKVATGLQYVVVAGTITYDDGFVERLPQHWDFCFQTLYNPKSKIDEVTVCEPSIEIPKLMKIIEYPKNEDRPDP
jgi:hypothetical protein